MKNVLVVDDIQDYLDCLEEFLSPSFNVLKAFNAKEAKEIIEKENIDLAIIDVRLDEHDPSNREGLLLLDWIRKNHPEVPVIMMSAYREFDYAVDALNLGAKYFIKKPLEKEIVLKSIQKALGEET